jgi:tellurite resistance protein TerC
MMALAMPAGASESALNASRFASFDVSPLLWAGFVGVITALLVADLLLVHRTPHVITFKQAAIESAVWISLGLGFSIAVLALFGTQAAGEFLTGYVIEKSLSVDNVFVWAVIFGYFGVPAAYQFRVLFWGIFGALVLRAVFIFAGVALLERFDWVLYVFGAVLILSAVRLARHQGVEVHPEANPVLRLVRRVVPSTTAYDGQRLLTRRNGRRLATPLLAVLILIESTDVVFAVDSIPAVLAVSREQFIVFASNALAILGLRSLYFLLAGMTSRFRYLTVGLAGILAFVGVKMLVADVYHVPTWVSLPVIAALLAAAIGASIRVDRANRGVARPGPAHPGVSDEESLGLPGQATGSIQRSLPSGEVSDGRTHRR